MPLITDDVSLVAVTALNGEACAKGCAEAEECTFAAVSVLESEGSPYLYVNERGGAHAEWESLELATWTSASPTDVIGVNDFVLVVNGDESLPLARSMNKGVSVVYLSGNDDMDDNDPLAGDVISADKVILVGENGYIWISTDYGDTWETVSSGGATTEDLTAVMICRQNPAVVYAIGENNAMVASYNGGYTWVSLTGPAAGDNLTAIEVIHENDLLIGTNDGELWMSSDGGNSWVEQGTLPGLPGTATIVSISCCACGSVDKHGACFLAVADGAGTDHLVFSNVGWGTAQWQTGTGFTDLDLAPYDGVCCNNNRALIVGGNGTDEGFTALIA